MQAIEKTLYTNYWITLVLLFLFVLIFLLKVVDAKLLKQQISKLFQVPFVPLETEDNVGVFNSYQFLIFLFNSLIISVLCVYAIRFFKDDAIVDALDFLLIFLSTFLFFVFKWIFEYLLALLFLIKKPIKIFVLSKWNYLFSLSFYIYAGIILHEFAKLSLSFLFYAIAFLLFLRFLFILITNKKLIFNKLFYFILYICAFEIAPLFLLFKSVI